MTKFQFENGWSYYEFAQVAACGGTKEAEVLARRWKDIMGRYAMLSGRYLKWAKEMVKLRLHISEIERLYKETDQQFDEVCEEMEALYKDLEQWVTEPR